MPAAIKCGVGVEIKIILVANSIVPPVYQAPVHNHTCFPDRFATCVSMRTTLLALSRASFPVVHPGCLEPGTVAYFHRGLTVS